MRSYCRGQTPAVVKLTGLSLKAVARARAGSSTTPTSRMLSGSAPALADVYAETGYSLYLRRWIWPLCRTTRGRTCCCGTYARERYRSLVTPFGFLFGAGDKLGGE